MKIFNKILPYVLPGLVLLLLIFIPLYPKLPLVDIKNTWVYIRVEDFLVLLSLLVWFWYLLKNKVTLKTPLTIPILAFWILGAVATIHGVVIIFPSTPGAFPHIALLEYLRHIEYLSMFFLAFSAVKSKKFVFISIWTIVFALLGVIGYGFGQRYLSFPAYLTMNEEYAKGIPIIISALNRVSSTFAGHYDLAAYLVLVIPIVVSLVFGFRNIFIKLFLIATSVLGIVLLFMTVSRVSFFVLFISLFAVFLFHKKKLFFVFVPVACLLGALFFLTNSSLLDRFGNTVKEIDVLVEAKTGNPIGQVSFSPKTYLNDKFILRDKPFYEVMVKATESGIINAPIGLYHEAETVPYNLAERILPENIGIVQAHITSTGETLPQGSSYVNLPLSPVVKRLENFVFEYKKAESTTSATVKIISGGYLVKRASAYDLSFTTRFQGEWPNAINAFMRNLFFGSGYGSVSLAVDNNYYRMLGEVGILGTLAFVSIFIVLGIYIKKMLPSVESKVIRSFALGFAAGVIGLSLNAILIDVFEASKVAFQLWLLTGLVVGALSLYQTKSFNVYKELYKAGTSSWAIIIYLLLITVTLFIGTINHYFIGDDFTWFRWAADCKINGNPCTSLPTTIFHYFTNSDGFFYRPGTKTYFLLMYPAFWLNQVMYHVVSIVLHFAVVVMLFMLAKKIFRNQLYAAVSSFVFLILSAYLEIVLWISATGHLFNAAFIMASLLLFIKWYEGKKIAYAIISGILALISMTFYELGIVTPLLMVAYVITQNEKYDLKSIIDVFKNKVIALLFVPSISYLLIRFLANTFWFHGDYSYNILKLPVNVPGNIFGYILMTLAGPMGLSAYDKIRTLTKTNIPLTVIVGIILVIGLIWAAKMLLPRLSKQDLRITVFSLLFFTICLLPFLGFGNITYRYSYLASFGIVMIFVLIISRLYRYLHVYGKDIALVATTTVFTVFCLVHIIQFQQLIIDWRSAGGKVETFLKSIDSVYTEAWSDINSELIFVDVPVKNEQAYVFPWGLADAVWFAFKSDKITVSQVAGYEGLPKDVYSDPSKWVLQFNENGSVDRLTVGNKKIEE